MASIKAAGFDTYASETAGFTSNGLNVIVSAEDPARVASTTEDVLAAITERTDLVNLKSDLVTATPEVQITVDPTAPWLSGSTARDRREVRAALSPTVATQVTLEGDTDPATSSFGSTPRP